MADRQRQPYRYDPERPPGNRLPGNRWWRDRFLRHRNPRPGGRFLRARARRMR